MEAVVGIFAEPQAAERAADNLLAAGIASEHISILTPGASAQDITSLPTDEAEQPGVGRASGARVGGGGSGAEAHRRSEQGGGTECVGGHVASAAAELVRRVEDIPVADGAFDLVVCTQGVEDATDPARAIRELRRVVAPGGRV